MSRIQAGTYREIDEERLALFPFAPCCTGCQKQREGLGLPPGITM